MDEDVADILTWRRRQRYHPGLYFAPARRFRFTVVRVPHPQESCVRRWCTRRSEARNLHGVQITLAILFQTALHPMAAAPSASRCVCGFLPSPDCRTSRPRCRASRAFVGPSRTLWSRNEGKIPCATSDRFRQIDAHKWCARCPRISTCSIRNITGSENALPVRF